MQKLPAVMERFASLKDPGPGAAARLAAFHAAAFNEYVVLMVLHINCDLMRTACIIGDKTLTKKQDGRCGSTPPTRPPATDPPTPPPTGNFLVKSTLHSI